MVKVKIERLSDQLEGIGYVGGKIIFVPKALVGDEVDVEIVEEKSKYQRGKVVPSYNTVDCPYFYRCGGCHLRNTDYTNGLNLKLNNLNNLLKKYDIKFKDIKVIKNNYNYNYRNKVSFKIVNKVIGFYFSKSYDIEQIDKCLLVKESINDLISYIKDFGIINGEVTVRCNYNDELLIIINTEDNINYDFNILKDKFKIAGVILNDKKVLNEDYFFDKINDYLFKVSYDSFFQVNNKCAGEIFNIIEKNINDDDTVLDLYSGVGTLSICASKKAKYVLGVEVVKNAVLNALVNKNINKVENIDFSLGDVPKVLEKLNKEFNCFIFDPPRKGLDNFTIDYTLEKLPKKIIYVSCNPITLVRDLDKLKQNYNIKDISLIDMFSYTYHYETVVILERKD